MPFIFCAISSEFILSGLQHSCSGNADTLTFLLVEVDQVLPCKRNIVRLSSVADSTSAHGPSIWHPAEASIVHFCWCLHPLVCRYMLTPILADHTSRMCVLIILERTALFSGLVRETEPTQWVCTFFQRVSSPSITFVSGMPAPNRSGE